MMIRWYSPKSVSGFMAGRSAMLAPGMAMKRGVSIVELLVVIGIMVAVLAVAIPVVRLTTSDNRVSLATQSIRSFLQGAALQADRHGKSYVIFERSANAPDLCYRLLMGRPRSPYRGEGETAYAIMAPPESIALDGVATLNFDVFYLFDADAAKISPYEFLTFRDRPERYLIYRAFQLPDSTAIRPVAKVFCRLDPREPLLPPSDPMVPSTTAGLQSLVPGTEFLPFAGTHPNWLVAAQTIPRRSSNGAPAGFWPEDRVFYPSVGTADPGDIPNFIVGTPGQFVSRLLPFEVSQPPALDELNSMDLPSGIAIYLGASGFDNSDGFADGGGFLQFRQFAFRDDLGSVASDPVKSALQVEVVDEGFEYVRNQDSLVRAEYFPRIEFEKGGRIERAFGMSPAYAAATSYAVNASNVQLTRQGPIRPLSQLFLLVGEDNILERQNAIAGVIANDYWVMFGSQTSTPKIVKAQPGDALPVARQNVANSVSER